MKRIVVSIGLLILFSVWGIAYAETPPANAAVVEEAPLKAAQAVLESRKVSVESAVLKEVIEAALKAAAPTDQLAEAFRQQILHGHYLLYSLFCGFVSVLVKIVDYVVSSQVDENGKIDAKNVIKIQAVPLVGWFFSATVVGYLAAVTGFLPLTPQGAVIVGFAWPMVYKHLKEKQEEEEKKAAVGADGQAAADKAAADKAAADHAAADRA
ncbi:MAG: hypothetical protein WCL08_11545 [Verrucomicrobiota bacterium]